MRELWAAALAIGLAAFPQPAPAQGIPVDLELVLAVDVSGSVDEHEYSLQMIGIAEALRLPEVGELIASHRAGVALTLVHWSAGHVNRQVVPWRLLHDAADASRPSRNGNRCALAGMAATASSEPLTRRRLWQIYPALAGLSRG